MNTQKFTLRDEDRSSEHLTGWLSVPALPALLHKKANRMMSRIRTEIQPATLIVYKIDRIANPPRKFEVSTFKIKDEEGFLLCVKNNLSPGESLDLKNTCALMTPVAEEIVSRWPKKIRPDSITLITDGGAIWFNPDYPFTSDMEWLGLHLTGSPSAIICAEKNHKPLSKEWMEDQ